MRAERSTSLEPAPSRPHMPGYGLPEGPDGLMPWSWAEQRHCGQGTTDRSPGRYRSENEVRSEHIGNPCARKHMRTMRTIGFPGWPG